MYLVVICQLDSWTETAVPFAVAVVAVVVAAKNLQAVSGFQGQLTT